MHAALEMIRRNVAVQSRLIDDLLDLTHIARGQLDIAHEPVDLHQVMRDAVAVCQDDIAARRQQLDLALDAAGHHTRGDAQRLQQVVWNLLKNASKFTPAEGQISLRSSSDDGKFRLSVSDSGMGIDAQAMPRIFDAFIQEGDWVTRQYGGLGLGLGLAISKAAVEAHGGTLSASSAGRGHGATFLVELPLEPPP